MWLGTWRLRIYGDFSEGSFTNLWRQSKKNKLYFLFWKWEKICRLKQLKKGGGGGKYKTMICKTLDIRQQKRIPERQNKNEVGPVIAADYLLNLWAMV